jgi:hypothetical protein
MHPPGWYPSPYYPDSMQYWNGTGWTAQIQPREHLAKAKAKTGLRVVAGFFLFLGLVLLSLTTPSVVEHLAPGFNKVVTTGQVVDIDLNKIRRTGSGWLDHCKSTAEFTVDGTRHEARSELYVYPCEWKIGDSVQVTYDPRHPEYGAIVEESRNVNMFGTWLFFSIGSLLALACASILGTSLRRRIRQQP